MYCPVCGRSLADTLTDVCPICHELFVEDYKAGNFPPPLDSREFWTWPCWISLRVIEREGERAKKSKETIHQEVLARAAEIRKAYEDQKRKEEEKKNIEAAKAKIRNRYSY